MTKSDRTYAPHLTVNEASLPPGEEWMPKRSAWTLIQAITGSGYWLGPRTNQDLKSGTVLLLSAYAPGAIRASHVGELRLHFVPVNPERLTGLITLTDQRCFDAVGTREEFSVRIFPPDSPIATRMKNVCAGRNRNGSLSRLRLLELFLEIFGSEMKAELSEPAVAPDAKARLQEFLRTTPTSELLHMSFSELAQVTRCTPRHLNRIFNEVVGMSFRDKHTELRLARACELLATTESKVVDVALESGYQSLSLFNLMFVRRFGTSPGKWRRIHRGDKAGTARRGAPKVAALWSDPPRRPPEVRRGIQERICA
jgi:AraC-like DNA-binding protein